MPVRAWLPQVSEVKVRSCLCPGCCSAAPELLLLLLRVKSAAWWAPPPDPQALLPTVRLALVGS